MLQGGDYEHGDGTGGASIYGPTFDDEEGGLRVPHTVGALASANAGPHTNGSQFYICAGEVGAPVGTPAHSHLNGKHVVFGRVVSGWPTVRAAEAAGTRSGAPRVPVVIVDCGVEEEGGEGGGVAAAVGVTHDPAAASRARAASFQAAAAAAPVSRPPVRTAQDELAELEAEEKRAAQEREAEAPAAADAVAATTTTTTTATPAAEAGDEDPTPAAEAGDEDPTPADDGAAPPTSRAGRLAALRRKLACARKANAGAVIAERKRAARPPPTEDAAAGGAAKAWVESRSAAAEAELARIGARPDQAHLLDRADTAAWKAGGGGKRRRGGPAPDPEIAGEGGAGGRSAAAQYARRAAALPSLRAAAAAAASASGAPHIDPPEALDALVAEVTYANRGGRARARVRTAADDSAAINTFNASFNAKIERSFGGVAAEIKANLERGTALPDNGA